MYMGGLKLPLWKIGQVTARILAMQPRSMGNRSSLTVSAHLSSALSYNRSLAAHSTALGR